MNDTITCMQVGSAVEWFLPKGERVTGEIIEVLSCHAVRVRVDEAQDRVVVRRVYEFNLTSK